MCVTNLKAFFNSLHEWNRTKSSRGQVSTCENHIDLELDHGGEEGEMRTNGHADNHCQAGVEVTEQLVFELCVH